MLIHFETFEDRNEFLWSVIHTSQKLIKVINSKQQSELSREVVSLELEVVKNTYVQLKELRGWRNGQQEN